jgi:hypothetical protein
MNNQSTLSFLWGGLQPPPPRQPKASTSLYSGNHNSPPLYQIPSPTPQTRYRPPQSNNQFFSHPPQEGSTAHEIFSGRIFFSSHKIPSSATQTKYCQNPKQQSFHPPPNQKSSPRFLTSSLAPKNQFTQDNSYTIVYKPGKIYTRYDSNKKCEVHGAYV